VVLAAVLRSDMTIAAAIRDLPEPTNVSRGSLALRLRYIGLAVASLFALVIPSPPFPEPLRLVGGPGLIAVAALTVRDAIRDRARLTSTGLALAAWALTSLA